MIYGKRIHLRLMEDTDIPTKVLWVNDEEIRGMLVSDYISIVGTKTWFSKVINDSTRKELMICLNDTHETIGFTSIKNIDHYNSKAEISMLLGNKKYWGKGFAKEARSLLLDYAFSELNLNKIYTYNLESNEKIIGLNESLGFKIEGVLIDNIFFLGSFRNTVVMGILKSEWQHKN